MLNEGSAEVYKQHREVQNQYTFCLLAASGAAIAFAVNQTQNAVISWSMIPLGAAVLCWGISFYCGCCYLNYAESVLYSNMGFRE
jgi:hypothetical protein